MSKLDGRYKVGEHTLVFNINALCDFEDHFGVDDINEVFARLTAIQERPSARFMRDVFHIMLRQDDPDISLIEAGQVVSDLGLADAVDALGEVFSMAFPEAQVVEEDEGNAPKRAGTRKKS